MECTGGDVNVIFKHICLSVRMLGYMCSFCVGSTCGGMRI